MAQLDLYTLEEIVAPSDEHVVPSFLGGRLCCVGMLDKRTNDRFGSGIDACLERALRPVLTTVDARGHRQKSRPAPTVKGVSSTDGKRYDIEAGGKVTPRPDLRFVNEGSSIRLSGSAPNKSVLKRELTKWLRRQGLDIGIVEQVLAAATPTTSEPPRLELPFELFDTECYRAMAKIACNLFALDDADSFRSQGFHDIRRWVLGTHTMAPPPIAMMPPLVDPDRFGDFDHLVRVTVTSSGVVEATVQILGHIAFALRLGETNPGNPRVMSYRVDQIGRQVRQNAAADLKLTPESFAEANGRSFEEFHALVPVQLERLWQQVRAHQQAQVMTRMIVEAAEEVGFELATGWRDEKERDRFADVLATKYAEHFVLQRMTVDRRGADANDTESA